MFIDGRLVDVKVYSEWVNLHSDDKDVKDYFMKHPGKTYIDAYQELCPDVQKKLEV
jgi:hypothetical protein